MPGIEVNFTQNFPAGRLVLGEPLSVGDTKLVPVISVMGAYGEVAQHGGGGGFSLNPVAVVAVQDDQVSVFSLQNQVEAEKLAPLLNTMLGEKQGSGGCNEAGN